jgi:hypothetical protein
VCEPVVASDEGRSCYCVSSTAGDNGGPDGWKAISSGGEKRIKAWYAADVVRGYVVTGLVIGLGVVGGAVVTAMEDVREGAELMVWA